MDNSAEAQRIAVIVPMDQLLHNLLLSATSGSGLTRQCYVHFVTLALELGLLVRLPSNGRVAGLCFAKPSHPAEDRDQVWSRLRSIGVFPPGGPGCSPTWACRRPPLTPSAAWAWAGLLIALR